jgi:hypothetical protein
VRVGAEGGEEDSWGKDCKPKKNNREEGAMAWFRLEKKLGLGFFSGGCTKFLSLKKICPFLPSSPCWMFIYIENLYTFYLRKYCNNYCRDCLP